GKVTSESAPSNGDRYKFTGRELDSETGFQLHGERYFDPSSGRWTSEDPLGLLPDSNQYRYVGNNSTNLTDPSGLAPNEGGSLGAIMGGSFSGIAGSIGAIVGSPSYTLPSSGVQEALVP